MDKALYLLLLVAASCYGQKISVAELQLKIAPGTSEELYYGFEGGDRIIYNIEEISGGSLGEVAIIEHPQTYKFRQYNIKKERNREIKVAAKAVYKFTISNTGKQAQICSIKIQRVPDGKEHRNFNTAVKWVNRQDTVWNTYTKDIVKGYDTVYLQKTRKVIISEKKYEEVVLDKNQRVESKATFGQSKAGVAFTLPNNYISKDETKKVIAWAYWVGVGEESNEFWKQNRKMLVGAVQGATTILTSPLGGIAAGAVTNLMLPTNGEDVAYDLAREADSKLFFEGKPYKSYDSGKGVAAYKRFVDNDLLKGKFYVLLANDNYVQPIDVNVKVSAIIEHIKYSDETYTDRVVSPRYEKTIIREPQIVTAKVPVTFDYR